MVSVVGHPPRVFLGAMRFRPHLKIPVACRQGFLVLRDILLCKEMAQKKIKITFLGGATSVTGSNFLLETVGESKETRVMLDCGLFQGSRMFDVRNREVFQYDLSTLDALIVSHPHLDHTGRIPRLVKEGFRGRIISTPPTSELAYVMLLDSMGVLKKESEHDKMPPLYDEADVERTFLHWEKFKYHEEFSVGPLRIRFKDAGHVLGSAITEISYGHKKVAYTGDLGNTPAPLLPDTETLEDVNYLLIESVYGDRNHEHRMDRKAFLEDTIEETINRGGTLVIPAFSLERTQEVLFEIKEMRDNGRIPKVPVFLDSPLAIKVTDIYRHYSQYYKPEVRGKFDLGEDLFDFMGLHPTLTTEQSKAIAAHEGPKIIIAGSGMSNGGRILHHEKRYLSDPKSTLLIMGYQAPGTLGRVIQDGAPSVSIHGMQVPIRAMVKTISGYSAHKDSQSLIDYVQHSSASLEKVFVVLGELRSASFLSQRLRDFVGVDAVVPKAGDSVILNME